LWAVDEFGSGRMGGKLKAVILTACKDLCAGVAAMAPCAAGKNPTNDNRKARAWKAHRAGERAVCLTAF